MPEKLTPEQWDALRKARNQVELAQGWGCALSTMYRRLRQHWDEIHPTALEHLQTLTRRVETVAEDLCKTHHLMTFSELQTAERQLGNLQQQVKETSYLARIARRKRPNT